MDTFRAYLKDVENWQYEHSFEKTIWRYLKNVDYEFEVRSHMKWESENEPWMPEFFDNQRYREEVRLYVKGKLVEKNLFFVSFDGGRFLVPEPEI